MKRNNSIFALLFAVLIPVGFLAVLIFPMSRDLFQSVTAKQPYLMGFIKFALLATSGEILAGRVISGAFSFPKGIIPKAIIWGVIGMMIALLFPIYSAGVQAAQASGLLFGEGNVVITAIFTSIVNNLTFGIAMMCGHRITDKMIEFRYKGQKATVSEAVRAVDWSDFVGFVVFKTIPFFWIPVHSVTFMLPSEYRVYLSAFLSIVLGLLLAIGKKKSDKA